MHGKASSIEHDGQAMFAGLTNASAGSVITRWLAVTFPAGLTMDAHFDGMVMAVVTMRWRCGFQFHPESISPPGRSPAGTNAGLGAAETRASQHAATVLEKLYQAQTLSQQESHQLFSAVVRGELKPEATGGGAGQHENSQ
ncbi:glutamine amidotransferase-related protein [Escherichia coli]